MRALRSVETGGLLFLATVLAGSIPGCGADSEAKSAAEGSQTRLTVVCTTGMIADAAAAIAGDLAEVSGLMGPGVDPHLYKASREDQRRIERASLVLYHGLHLEGKMADYLEDLHEERPEHSVVAVAEAIPPERLLRNPAVWSYPDPHVWFDLELWRLVVLRIEEAFRLRDPTHAAEYASRAARYLADLEATHAWAKEKAAELPDERRRIVTSHDAYNYFGRAYGFEVHGLQGISTETQAGVYQIEEAVKYIRRHRVPVIFAETSVSPAAVELVASKAGSKRWAKELYSDALGKSGTPAGSFLGMFRYNLETIVEALRAAADQRP
jgi:manganese/zinc/iron transport system substrate-binding protein